MTATHIIRTTAATLAAAGAMALTACGAGAPKADTPTTDATSKAAAGAEDAIVPEGKRPEDVKDGNEVMPDEGTEAPEVAPATPGAPPEEVDD